MNCPRRLVNLDPGPVSVTIHIPLPSHEFETPTATATRHFIAAVKELEALYASSPHFATHVDVHLALSPFSSTASATTEESDHSSATTEGARQFNVWRNIARLFARTEFVMMLDVDFAICTDWRSAIKGALDAHRYKDMKAPRPGLLVEPAGYVQGDGGILPLANGEFMQQLRDGKVALVVPAFEYVRQEDGVDQSTFPRDKEVCYPIPRQ